MSERLFCKFCVILFLSFSVLFSTDVFLPKGSSELISLGTEDLKSQIVTSHSDFSIDLNDEYTLAGNRSIMTGSSSTWGTFDKTVENLTYHIDYSFDPKLEFNGTGGSAGITIEFDDFPSEVDYINLTRLDMFVNETNWVDYSQAIGFYIDTFDPMIIGSAVSLSFSYQTALWTPFQLSHTVGALDIITARNAIVAEMDIAYTNATVRSERFSEHTNPGVTTWLYAKGCLNQITDFSVRYEVTAAGSTDVYGVLEDINCENSWLYPTTASISRNASDYSSWFDDGGDNHFLGPPYGAIMGFTSGNWELVNATWHQKWIDLSSVPAFQTYSAVANRGVLSIANNVYPVQWFNYSATSGRSLKMALSEYNGRVLYAELHRSEGSGYYHHELWASNLNLPTVDFPYINSDSVVITSDLDFELQEWTGNGSQSNPYIIEYLWIEQSVSDGISISISGTNAFFEIRHCYLNTTFVDAFDSGCYGIKLNGIGNGLVTDNILIGYKFGIRTDGTDGIHIEQNIIDGAAFGIMSFSSTPTLTATVTNNTVQDCQTGIYIQGVLEVYNNTCIGGIWGILTYPTASSIIRNNTCDSNTYGITLDITTHDTVVANNSLKNSGMYGIELTGNTYNNTIIWNTFNSSHNQALDNGANSTFNYNYWSDYDDYDLDEDGFGDTPYSIPGTAGSVDPNPRGPMCTTIVIDWHGGLWLNDTTFQLSAQFGVNCSYYVYTPATIHTDLISEFSGESGNITAGESTITIHVTDRFWGASILFNTSHTLVEATWYQVQKTGYSSHAVIETESTLEFSMRFDMRTHWIFMIDGLVRHTGIVNDSRWSQEYLDFVFEKDASAGLHNYSFRGTDDLNTHYYMDFGSDDFVLSSPVISDIPDQDYDYGSTGNVITWTPSDESPNMYDVWLNGSLYDTGPWTGTPITVAIDNLEVGPHNFTLFVNDTIGLVNTHTVIVTVYDKAPILYPLNDIIYYEHTTGNTITWVAADYNPDFYTVYQGGEVYASDNWDNSPIIISIDGLPMGIFNFTIVVYDTNGNSVIDTLFVTVLASTVTTTTTTTTNTTSTTTNTTASGFDSIVQSLSIALSIGASAVILVVIFLIFRSRGEKYPEF